MIKFNELINKRMKFMKIGVLGYASVGKNLEVLFKNAGYTTIIGVRSPEKYEQDNVTDIVAAAKDADTVVLAIPYRVCSEVLPDLKMALSKKIVIDATNPLNEDYSPILFDKEDSAGETLQRILGESMMVKAFNTIFADNMTREKLDRDGRKLTTFIAGDNDPANEKVLQLAEKIGFSPINTGPLKNSRYLEGMAHLNIQIAFGQGKGADVAFLYDY
tara:strand:- start:338 stop:988 length:651 start_codon:yes stop_codon:yes gene_type:complete